MASIGTIHDQENLFSRKRVTRSALFCTKESYDPFSVRRRSGAQTLQTWAEWANRSKIKTFFCWLLAASLGRRWHFHPRKQTNAGSGNKEDCGPICAKVSGLSKQTTMHHRDTNDSPLNAGDLSPFLLVTFPAWRILSLLLLLLVVGGTVWGRRRRRLYTMDRMVRRIALRKV